MAIDRQRAVAAIGEPTRFRILELLAQSPHTVGEVAAAVGALQPQTTKHLQALEAAGVVGIHRLGRRRIASLNRGAMAELAEHFAGLAVASRLTDADDEALDRYERSVAEAESQLAGVQVHRRLHFTRTLAVPLSAVWDAWTRPHLAATWWAPRHFTVSAYDIDAVTGGAMRVVLREGDGASYESTGRVLATTAPRRLVFDLAPIDPAGERLFDARYTLTLDGGEPTTLNLEIEATARRPEAAAAVAGLELGWQQLLDRLRAELEKGGRGPSQG